MWGATKAVRTRDNYNERYEQTTHGERFSDQTPAGMFLERLNALATDRLPRVSAIRRSKGGKLSVWENLETRESILAWVIDCVDGHKTAYDIDDYSARLIVLDEGNRLAWLEMLHPGTNSLSHPEIDY